ncbi:MAG: family 1 glycosylhydrolase [Planctomycetaceae bacterium]|nr:family 1 glycosylhydrolase [Planctomycetaceae bacterium]
MQERDFPEDFVWGAATCPPCCEGETVSDWGKLSAPDGSVPDDGPHHWRRYRYDFRAMADLGLKAYRFGIDWARLQREPNAPLAREDTYRYMEMLADLRSHGIEPWVTLFHHALPRWALKAGGWLNRETPYWFADFARRLADVSDGEVIRWIPIHEPQLYCFACHAWDGLPGGEWGRLDHVRLAFKNLAHGHRLAAAALRQRLPHAKIGLSLPGGCFFPNRVWHPGDHVAAGVADWLLNRYGLRKFGRPDFVMLRTGNELRLRAFDTLSLGSGVSPTLPARMRHGGGGDGFSRPRRKSAATWLRRLRAPVYLVGHGDATLPDGGLHTLLSSFAGSPAVAGFFYDPLLDGFDLTKGLASGGGLLQVDFHGRERRRELRNFAKPFARVVRTGTLKSLAKKERRHA